MKNYLKRFCIKIHSSAYIKSYTKWCQNKSAYIYIYIYIYINKIKKLNVWKNAVKKNFEGWWSIKGHIKETYSCDY